MNSRNPYSPPETNEPATERQGVPWKQGGLGRVIFGCIAAMVSSAGAFASAIERFQSGDIVWTIVALASGTVVLVAGAFVLLRWWQAKRRP